MTFFISILPSLSFVNVHLYLFDAAELSILLVLLIVHLCLFGAAELSILLYVCLLDNLTLPLRLWVLLGVYNKYQRC